MSHLSLVSFVRILHVTPAALSLNSTNSEYENVIYRKHLNSNAVTHSSPALSKKVPLTFGEKQ